MKTKAIFLVCCVTRRIIYSPNLSNLPINLRNVPAGVYVLRVTDADGHEYHQKIVKK